MNDLRLPEHIAMIMDGKWKMGKRKSLKRTAGHKKAQRLYIRNNYILPKIRIKYLIYMLFNRKLEKTKT